MKTRLKSHGQIRPSVGDRQAAAPAAGPANCKWLIQLHNSNCSRYSRFNKHFHIDPAQCGYAVAYNWFIRGPAKPAEPASAFSNQCLMRRKLRVRARGPGSPGNVARGLTALWRGDVDLEPGSARTLWCRGPPSSRDQIRAPRAKPFACPMPLINRDFQCSSPRPHFPTPD
jgi:hypothetical protein